jgi:hypothetical protein
VEAWSLGAIVVTIWSRLRFKRRHHLEQLSSPSGAGSGSNVVTIWSGFRFLFGGKELKESIKDS